MRPDAVPLDDHDPMCPYRQAAGDLPCDCPITLLLEEHPHG